MFRHALVPASLHPTLAAGQAWPGLLSPREAAILATLAFLPRRRKWLLGRAAAKQLLRECLPDRAATEVSILNRDSGEPYVFLEGEGEWARPISLSHRSEVGLAAVPTEPGMRIGADIEAIAPRDPALVRQFFTEEEAAWVAASGQERDEVVARIWSGKEAVLKLLGVGLRLDTRTIVCGRNSSSFSGCPAGFCPCEVTVPSPPPEAASPRALRVAWRRVPGHVLTVALAG
jgi:phosphopantetheinyl transferase